MNSETKTLSRPGDRRRYRRYSVAVSLRLTGEERSPGQLALITQVSPDGVSLWTKRELSEGQILILNKGSAFPMVGEIHRTRLKLPGGASRYSVSFRPEALH